MPSTAPKATEKKTNLKEGKLQTFLFNHFQIIFL